MYVRSVYKMGLNHRYYIAIIIVSMVESMMMYYI